MKEKIPFPWCGSSREKGNYIVTAGKRNTDTSYKIPHISYEFIITNVKKGMTIPKFLFVADLYQ
jgi:hypothetical protein